MTVSPPRAVATEPTPAVDRPPAAAPADEPRPSRRWTMHTATAIVLVVGLAITVALSFGAQSVHDNNENRLLRQRVREAAAVLTAATGSVQAPLEAGAVLAESTNADAGAFERLMKPFTDARTPFVTASIWPVAPTSTDPLVLVGEPPELRTEPLTAIRRLFRSTRGLGTFSINNLLDRRERRLGYAVTIPSKTARYVVYAETAALPRGRRAQIDRDSAFADLGYALYLGSSDRPENLLASSTGGGIVRGRRAAETATFGSSKLYLVMTPTKELGGSLLARLPWLFGLFGVVLTVAAALLVDRLTRRRAHAEALARENAQLYAEQRTVAQTLQQSLLPQRLPELPGVEFASAYVAGTEGMDVGGDWYDVVDLGGERVLFVVGDVSGRGLPAATMMASLRYAIRAYAIQGDGPAAILTKLSRLVSIARDGHFATVLCAAIDVAGHRATVANGGHPEPLLIVDGRATFIATRTGVPVGVDGGSPYREIDVDVPAGATLLAYTDGLVERRGESLDVGLARLVETTVASSGTIDDMLRRVLAEAIPSAPADDTAALAVRWLA